MRAEAAAIAARRAVLERSLAERERAVERMLAAQQASRAPDALRVALSGEDPAAVARSLHYVSYLARASAAMLADYRATLDEAGRLAARSPGEARAPALRASRRAAPTVKNSSPSAASGAGCSTRWPARFARVARKSRCCERTKRAWPAWSKSLRRVLPASSSPSEKRALLQTARQP